MPVANTCCPHSSVLRQVTARLTRYISRYESVAGGPLIRRLVPKMTEPTRYSTKGTSEKMALTA